MEEEQKKPDSRISYEEMIEQAPDAVVVLDNLGFIRYMNTTAEIISGYRRQELIGKHFAETGVVAPLSIPVAVREFARTLSGEHGPPYEIEMFRKDKTKIKVENHCRPIMENGKVTGVNLIMRYLGPHKEGK